MFYKVWVWKLALTLREEQKAGDVWQYGAEEGTLA
jgi:hypothetical protein